MKRQGKKAITVEQKGLLDCRKQKYRNKPTTSLKKAVQK